MGIYNTKLHQFHIIKSTGINLQNNLKQRLCSSFGFPSLHRVLNKIRTKGFGFVMFTRHEDALACLRKLNNNPDIFDKNNRPIVSFSIEDRTALNARKKRLEKSIANNPLANKDESSENNKKNRKRKQKFQPDESYVKKRKFDKNESNQGEKKFNRQENNQKGENKFDRKGKNNKQFKNNNDAPGKFVRRPTEDNEYTGLTAKEGGQHKMRANFKLKAQAEVHRQNVKFEKKNSKRAMRLKMAMKERVKQPKQKINKSQGKKKRKKAPHHKTGTL